MSDGVTQFPNALQINNNTPSCLTLQIQAGGYKQLFSPSWLARNVPEGSTSDGYTLTICPNSSYKLGVGFYRDSDYDQSANVTIANYGTLTFNGSTQVNGDNIQQNASWQGSVQVSLQVYNSPLKWDFNNPNNGFLGLTFT